jgi:hypothetical protein
MAAKRVLLVSAGLTGLLLATLWIPGIAHTPPRVARTVPVDESGIISLHELVRQQAAAYAAGQVPKPTLYGKDLITERNAGARKEPAFNWASGPHVDATHPAAASKSAAQPAGSGNSPAATGSSAKPAAQPAGSGNGPAAKGSSAKPAAAANAPSKDAAPAADRAKHSPLPPGYHADVKVLAPGRLDWTYVLSDQSYDPEVLAANAVYQSTRQSYEFFAPPPRVPVRPYPLILSISTSPRSGAWGYFGPTCQKHGALFAGVHGAGNDVPTGRRARTVLDVLDDVRRRYPVDPDRTYIVGVSGAGHAADQIAHALPELFGGVMAICGAWNLRLEPTTRLRVGERLSEAVLTGETDFNRPELEREFFPILRHENIRSNLWVYPGMGHGCPGPAQLEVVFQWLEAGLPQRRLAGRVFPTSRLLGTPTAAEWSAAVVQEAGQRLSMPGGEESGLFLLQGVVNRWPTLPAADTARALLGEFDKVSAVPWKDIYRTERLRFRYLQAKQFDGILNSAPPPGYSVPRSNLVNIGVSLWQDIQELSTPDSPTAKEAAARIADLQRQLGG